MEPAALLSAWLRALPLALCLPLPGISPRLALGLVLGLVGVGAAAQGRALPAQLAIGLLLGLGVAGPIWAARWAGDLLGVPLRAGRVLGALSGVLAWLAFFAVGGAGLLVEAYAESYRRWPPGTLPALDEGLLRTGAGLLGLAVRLALPSLLALAVVDVVGGVLSRFERGAGLAIDTPALVRGMRPLVVSLLLLGGLAALGQGIGAATRAWSSASITR